MFKLEVRHVLVELNVDHDAHSRLASVTDIFEVEVFDVWPAADSDKYHIGLEPIESRL